VAKVEKGEKPRKRVRWEKRHTEVVDTAAELFAEQGYHATSIEDLVQATGLQRGGLYHYIQSKQDLLIQIHERFIEPLLADSNEILAKDHSAEEAMRELARALMHTIGRYQAQVTVFLHEWRAVANIPEWHDVRLARKHFEENVESVIQRGIDEGVFEVRNLQLTRLAFLGMINYSYQWYSSSGGAATDEIADEFCDIMLTGIKRSAAPS
jgi:AcrR family transcriptional regulator